MTPYVSVVMGVYNGARYLREAVTSVLRQDGVPFEFVIVDDGSTDSSPAILAELARVDSRIRILTQSNAGLTAALIRGCAAARGEYIARQDADDLSLPGRLRSLSDMLDRDAGLAFVSSWVRWIGPAGEDLGVDRCPADSAAATSRLLYDRIGPPGHGTVMFRRSLYERAGGYRPEFYYGQDSDLWLRLALHGRLSYAQEVLYRPRRLTTGISAAHADFQRRFGRLGRECHAARLRGDADTVPLALARELREQVLVRRQHRWGAFKREAAGCYFIGAALVRQRDPRAMTYLLRAIRLWPLYLRAWAALFAAVPLLFRGRPRPTSEDGA